jgi:two-component system sensor histidine kinase VicK
MHTNTYTNISFVYDSEIPGLVFIDEAFAQFLQINSDNLTPGLLLSIVHPDDGDYVNAKFREFISGSTIDCVEFRILLNSEMHRVRVTPFLMNSTLIAVKALDITAEWNNFDSIRRYANKKNSILNMLAHDLRGPLGVARTLTKSIDKKIDDPSLLKMTRSVTEIIDQSVKLIVSLIDRELLETVDVELSMQRINIARKVSEYLEECKKSENAADRVFGFSSSSESIYLEVDEAKFMQIMNNLVTNSLKFTHPGALISMDILDRKDSVLFTFKDKGIGIPQNFHASIFDKFTPARRKGLNGEPTMGLGLSIVKMIIEWHHGKIWFESKVDIGTTIYFEIPKKGVE